MKLFILQFTFIAMIGCNAQNKSTDSRLVSTIKLNHYIHNTTGIISKDVFYFADEDGMFNAIDLIKKTILWKFDLKAYGDLYLKPLILDNRIILGFNNGLVVIIDINGNKIYEKNFNGRIKNELNYFKNSVLISVRGVGIVSLNADNFITRVLLPSHFDDTTTDLKVFNNLLIVGDLNRKIVCFDLISEKILWEEEFKGYMSTDPSVEDGKIFVGFENLRDNTTQIIVFEINTGHQISKYNLNISIRKKILCMGDKIVFQSRDSRIISFNLLKETVDSIIDYDLMTEILLNRDELIFVNRDYQFVVLDTSLQVKYLQKLNSGSGDPFEYNDTIYVSLNDGLYSLISTE